MDVAIVCILMLAAIGLGSLYFISQQRKCIEDFVPEASDPEPPSIEQDEEPAVSFSEANRDLGLPLLREVSEDKYCLLSDLSLGEFALASTPYGELEVTCYSIKEDVATLKTRDSEYEVVATKDMFPANYGDLAGKNVWRITDIRKRQGKWASRNPSRPLNIASTKQKWFRSHVVYDNDMESFLETMLIYYLILFDDNGEFLQPSEVLGGFIEQPLEQPLEEPLEEPVNDISEEEPVVSEDPIEENQPSEQEDTVDTSYGYDSAY